MSPRVVVFSLVLLAAPLLGPALPAAAQPQRLVCHTDRAGTLHCVAPPPRRALPFTPEFNFGGGHLDGAYPGEYAATEDGFSCTRQIETFGRIMQFC